MMMAALTVLLCGFLPLCSTAAAMDDMSSVDVCEESKAPALLQSRSKVDFHATALESFESVECLLLEMDVSFEDSEIAVWACEFADGVRRSIVGLTPEWISIHRGQMASGATMLKVDKAVIGEDTLTVAADSVVQLQPISAGVIEEVSDGDGVNPNPPLEGNRKWLAVRVTATDAVSSMSLDELSDSVFGTSGDLINGMERYNSCSHGLFTVQPFTGVTSQGTQISNGVVDVTINMNVQGMAMSAVETKVVAALTSLVGPLSTQFDHVLLALPPGTSGGIAYAYIGHYISVYADVWAMKPSAQVHEIGHNLGLGHANEGGSYKDQTGMMGYSYNNDEGPVMCFNGAKNWQLAWYQNHYALATPLQTSWTGDIIGFVNYKDTGATGKSVVVKVETGQPLDYYVSFNRAEGINSGTVEGQNKVLVHSTGLDGTRYAESELHAKLGDQLPDQDTYQISNFGGSGSSVNIKVLAISLTSSPPYARVSIYNPDAPTLPPTAGPTTPKPTAAPPKGVNWILGERGQSCDEACASLNSSCAAAELNLADTTEDMDEIAKVSGHICIKSVGWLNDFTNDFGPSKCTSPECCEDGSCLGWCFFGKTSGRACSVTPGGSSSLHQRFCPCVSNGPYGPNCDED